MALHAFRDRADRSARSARSAPPAASALLLLLATAVCWASPPEAPLSKRLRACTTCHNSENIKIANGYVPRIRGKPAGYLFNQLMNYRTHRRIDDTMNYLVRHLSRDYLRRIAEYFAAQRAPYPPPAPPAGNPALRQRGAMLVQHGDPAAGIPACSACHGERLTGVSPAIPGLIGLPRHYIVAQLNSWRLGNRHALPPDCMAIIASRMSPRDIQAVAAWLAARPVPENTRPAPGPVGETPLECGSIPRQPER